MKLAQIHQYLDELERRYNQPGFIAPDPISVPHRFSRLQDVEIAALFAAMFAWGQRSTSIAKANQLMALMDDAPHQFVLHHSAAELQRLEGFVHRTFQPTDLLYLVDFLQRWYAEHDSLEDAFLGEQGAFTSVQHSLDLFHARVFSASYAPARTRKHVSHPGSGSACKRLCMMLRWLVRQDDRGVDLGLWHRIPMSQLVCPCDVHVLRSAVQLKLLPPKPANWQGALALTARLKELNPHDPVRYDFALFGLSLEARGSLLGLE